MPKWLFLKVCHIYIYIFAFWGEDISEVPHSVMSEVPVLYHFYLNWRVVSVVGLFLIVKMNISK